MLVDRPRSNLELGLKTVALSLLLSHLCGLTYDFILQTDIRLAMDIFTMLSLFASIVMRGACLRFHQSDINAMERLDANPRFRVNAPFARKIRRQTVDQNRRYMIVGLVVHFLCVCVYMVHNMAVDGSFVTLVTYSPIDWSEIAPAVDTLAKLFYSLVGYIWAWFHAAGQFTVIILLRIACTEYLVFLESLATLDDQISERLTTEPDEERVVRDLLYEHARRHRELVVVMIRLRRILRVYTLVHFYFYMVIVVGFMARVLVISGSSSLGMALPILVTGVFYFETFTLCLLVEELVKMSRKVSFNLYNFDWPRYLPYGRTIKRTMLLMIMQANNTNDFSAGGLTTVSAELFAKSCRLVYTMMMCMSNLENTETRQTGNRIH